MKRCLFVDDSSVIRKVAKRILTSSEMYVIEASNGYEALDLCAEDMPDFIVLDSTLPDISTEEIIRRIRGIESNVPPRIAVCLTELDVPAIMRAKRAGAHGYMLKPFNRSQLLDQFRTLQVAA